MWDLPRAGLEPVSPALAGRFLTTEPPGKPLDSLFVFVFFFAHAIWLGGILVPRPGMEPVPPAVEAGSPNHWTARESPSQIDSLLQMAKLYHFFYIFTDFPSKLSFK